MTRIKNKLAESVRQAKNAQSASPPKAPAKKALAGKRGKSGAAASRRKSAPAAAVPAAVVPKPPGGDDARRTPPPNTTHQLFPQRVWPD